MEGFKVEGKLNSTWSANHGTYLSGQAEVDEVDLVAVEVERRWGAGRLRLLVGPDLRAKFDSQRLRLDEAIRAGQLDDVRREARRMIVAWRTLDRTATEAGNLPVQPDCWEVALRDGTVAVIVRDEEKAGLVRPEGRAVAVYTLEEVARLLDAYPTLNRTKIAFLGAKVTKISIPPDRADLLLNDAIPN